MSDAALEQAPTSTPNRAQDSVALAIASAREALVKYLPRAVQILTELAEESENDRVRLAAVESIADRVGLGKNSTTHLQVSQVDHDVAEIETAELLKRIGEQRAAIDAPQHSIESLIVHESEETLAPASTPA